MPPPRRFLAPFLLGAGSMLVLMVLLIWIVPRWLPPGGVVIRIGPAASPVSTRGVRDGDGTAADAPAASTAPAPPSAATPPAPPVVSPAAAVDTAPAGDAAAAAPAAARVDLPRGVLLVPVRGVKPGQLSDTYSQARGQGRRHDAIDIPAPRGTPVLATADGTVLKLFRSDRGGITLYELAPDRRTIYYYAHLDRYAAGMAESRALRQGEVIGYVGDSGNAGAGNYHLHFEITSTTDPRRYWAGTPQNPYPLLRRGGSQP